jgi:hypothetical protein
MKIYGLSLAPYWIESRSSVRPITAEPPTHGPLPDLYKGFRNPSRTITLRMTTAMFAGTVVTLSTFCAAYSRKPKSYSCNIDANSCHRCMESN